MALIDYGQSKQLPDDLRLQFARLILALKGGDQRVISDVLQDMGVVTDKPDAAIRTKMAYGMFDTVGKVSQAGGGS